MAIQIFDRMAKAVAKYLEELGWEVLVVGSPYVRQQPAAPKFQYEFVLKITAKPLLKLDK